MKVVVFTKNNARILSNPDNIESFKNYPNAVVNPDLSAVQGFAPHYWKLVDDKITPMTLDEMTQRLENHKIDMVDNTISDLPLSKIRYRNRHKMFLTISAMANIILLIALLYRK